MATHARPRGRTGSRRFVGLAVVAAGAILISGTSPAAGAGAGGELDPGAAPLRPAAPGAEVIPDSYLVVLSASADDDAVADVAAAALDTGAVVTGEFDTALNAIAVTADPDELNDLRARPEVAYVEPDVVVSLSDVTTQTDGDWALDRIDQATRPLDGAYRFDGTGAGVRAYIVDSGIRASHLELVGRVSGGFQNIDDGVGTGDCNGHGTAVAGVVGGEQFGVAKQVSLVPVRVFGCSLTTPVSNVIEGLEWVLANAQRPAVVNLSLGGPTSSALDSTVRNLVTAGLPVIVAAGNDGTSTTTVNACTRSPARTSTAITVAATDITDVRPSFSNIGSCVDLFAPGVAVVTAYALDASDQPSDDALVEISGTSFSAPYVAGAAVLALQDDPLASPARIADFLTATATAGVVVNPGAGSPNLLLRSPYGGPAGYLAQAPQRVASAVSVPAGTSVVVPLPSSVPAGATAVATNVTVSGVSARTFVSVCPVETPLAQCSETSSVNAYPGRDVSNLAVTQVGGQRALRVFNNEGTVLVSLDVVGHFNETSPSGLDFVPLTPVRDNETPTIGAGASTSITLGDVPAGAQAVAMRVTVAAVTANTYVSACPVSQAISTCAQTSSLNARQRDTSNLVVVPLGTDRTVRLYNNAGSVIALTDVLGYYSSAGTGARYVAVAPRRIQAADPLGRQASVTRSVAPFVPTEATAVAVNVTVAGSSSQTFVSVCPAGTPATSCDNASTTNPYPGNDVAASTLVGTGATDGLTYFNNAGSVLLFTDLQGYFVPRP